MPIKPENRHHYRGNAWKDLRAKILARAGNRCEFCFVPNGEIIYRGPLGQPICHFGFPNPHKAVRVVLTIAHINQDPADNRDVNLRALCQRCHNLIDLPYRLLNAQATRQQRAAATEVLA